MEKEELDSVNHGTETQQLEGEAVIVLDELDTDIDNDVGKRDGNGIETETQEQCENGMESRPRWRLVGDIHSDGTETEDGLESGQVDLGEVDDNDSTENGMESRPRWGLVGDIHSDGTETEDGLESGQVDRETTIDLGEVDDNDSTDTIKLEGDKEATNNKKRGKWQDTITEVVRRLQIIYYVIPSYMCACGRPRVAI